VVNYFYLTPKEGNVIWTKLILSHLSQPVR